jgi:AMMECR1 domain-containing protein
MLDFSQLQTQINEQLKRFEELSKEELTNLLASVGLLQACYISATQKVGLTFDAIQSKLVQLSQPEEITEA